MVNKTVIFILVLSFLELASTFVPARVDAKKCKKRHGNFPKPNTLCKSYYECYNWVPVERKCPGDQHFFPMKEYCVWPEEFPCLEKPKSKECIRPNGKFLKPNTGCRQFYDCCGGVPTEKTCPGDQLFNPNRETCDWSELYTCIDDPVSKECPKPNGKFLKKGTECRIYYDCRNDMPTERECPGDQVFNPNKEGCEWMELYTCEDDSSSVKPTKSTTITSTAATSTPSTPTVDPNSSEEDSSESNENSKSSTVSEKVSSTTSLESSTFTPTIDPDSSEEDSSESNESTRSSTESENPFSTTSLEPSTSTPMIDITSEDDFTSSSLQTVSITEDNTDSTTLENDLSSFTLESSSASEENSDSTASKNDLTSLSLDPASVTEENTGSTASEEDYTNPSLEPASVSEEITVSEDDLTSPSLEPASVSEENTPSTVSDDYLTSLEPSSVSEEDPDSTASENDSTSSSLEPASASEEITVSKDDLTSSSLEPASDSEENTYSTVADDDLTTLNIFCPEPNGYFPHPTDRHKFIGCVGGDPRIIECPSNLVYVHKKRACDYDIKILNMN